jgi:hypothetical protein
MHPILVEQISSERETSHPESSREVEQFFPNPETDLKVPH